MKRNYDRPEMLVTMVKLGVFGQYGQIEKDEFFSIFNPDRQD